MMRPNPFAKKKAPPPKGKAAPDKDAADDKRESNARAVSPRRM